MIILFIFNKINKKMDSLELTTFKSIFNRLSVETRESFIKEIRYGIYYNMVDEMGKHEIFSTLNLETKNFILTMVKKSNDIPRAIGQSSIQDLHKYGLVFKLTNEFILLKNSKIRLFHYIDSYDNNEIFLCISPSDLIDNIDEHNIKWLNDWSPYSVALMLSLNVEISHWKFQSNNGKMTSIANEFTKLGVFDNM